MSVLDWSHGVAAAVLQASNLLSGAGAVHPAGNALPWKEMFDFAPHVFWALVILLAIVFVGPRSVREMVLSARKLGFGGFEIDLGHDVAAAAQARHITLPPQVQSQLARRLTRLQPLVRGARLLWIDDNPHNNTSELSVLTKLGAIIDIARTDQQAEHSLSSSVYDLVLSDMERGKEKVAGKRFLPTIREAISKPDVVFYVGQAQERPQDAFGLTNRPDELFHLVLDALERRRG